jgi:hypothetical protein
MNEKSIFKALVFADFLLLVLYLVTNFALPIPSWTFRHWFDLDAEVNIPTWFSSSQLFFIALVCIAYLIKLDNRRLQRFYVLAAAGFLFLSADETAQIHEGIGGIAMKTHIAHEYFPHLPQLWMLIYPAVALLLALVFWREIYAFLCDKKGNLIFFGGALVYVSGALGLEAVALYLIPATDRVLYITEVCFEETFEVLGQSIMCYAFLVKLATTHASTSAAVQLESQTADEAARVVRE